MKKLNLLTLALSSLLILGCSDRTEKFLDSYAVAEVVEIGDKDYDPDNYYEYISGHRYKNTKEAIENLQTKLKSYSEDTKAIANVFESESNKVQCIIVHRSNPSELTLTHELGHCFHLIYFAKLEKKAPSLLKIIEDDKKGHRFLIESFAEVAAATLAFGIDGDKSYIEGRLNKHDRNKIYSKNMEPYLRSLPLLESLSEFLDNADLPDTPAEKVEFILDEFYLNPEINNNIVRE